MDGWMDGWMAGWMVIVFHFQNLDLFSFPSALLFRGNILWYGSYFSLVVWVHSFGLYTQTSVWEIMSLTVSFSFFNCISS